MAEYLHQLFVVQSSRCIQHWQTVSRPNQIFLLQLFWRTSLCFTNQETQEQNVLGGPTLCGSVLNTPAISCTKFKIRSTHADSPMAKTTFFLQFFGRTSLCFIDKNTQKENELGGPTPLWVSIYTSYLLYKVQNPFNPCRQSYGQNRFLFLQFLERTSLYFTDQETQEENELGGPTPLWVSTCTSYPLYKVPHPISACRQSHGQNRFFSSSSFREDQPLLHRPKKLRKRICLVDQLPCGSVLTPAISCTKFQIHSTHADSPMTKTTFFFNFSGGPVFAL